MNMYQFIESLKLAAASKTLYVRGGWGQPLTDENKKHFIESYDFNRSVDPYGRNRAELIKKASADTFAFDCLCFVKSDIDGFCADPSLPYGGATYGKPCPDVTLQALMRSCSNVRNIQGREPEIGDLLAFSDYSHCGIYIGGGFVVECTYRWVDGVQFTKYQGRGWATAGKLPYIKEDPQPAPATDIILVQTGAYKQKSNANKYKQDGQIIIKAGDIYRVGYQFSTKADAETALKMCSNGIPADAFIVSYDNYIII